VEYFAAYAADNALLQDHLVNREVEETMEAFGLSINSRDISEREYRPLPMGLSWVGVVIDSSSLTVSSRSCIWQSPLSLKLEA